MSEQSPKTQSLSRRAWRAVLSSWGARLGLAWVALLLIMGGFAPLLANSYPLLWKVDGQWSSPMMQRLTATDVTWMVAVTSAAVLLLIGRWRLRVRLGVLLGVIVATASIAAALIVDKPLPDYERYRTTKAEFALFAPVRYSPNDRVRDIQQIEPDGPCWAGYEHQHWLGQNDLREDVASRMIHACRIVLSIGLIATGIAAVLGIVIGGFMGYFAAAFDLIGMRLVEVFEFIPQLFLLLMFAAFFPGDNPQILPGIHVQRIYLIMAIIGVTGWTGYARFVRAEFLKLRKQDFVTAAHALGLPLRSILFKHMLPNGLTPVLVSATFGIASAILAEATLSFLGFGLNEDPSWGQLLNQAARGGSFVWWIAIFPGLAIFLTVFAYNLIGEALRDAIDPHTQKA